MDLISSENKSTPRQNKYIFWHLGLDVKDCNLSLKDAADLIGQMKKEPKFVYDYLVQNYNAKVLDSKKIEKAISKKEKVMISNSKTKADLCREIHAADENLTAKQISQKVKCDLSVVYRALANKKDKPKKLSEATPLKYRQVLNHIKKTPKLENDNTLTLENLAESYNHVNNSNYTINDFSRCMTMIVKKGYGEKLGRGLYCLGSGVGSNNHEIIKPKDSITTDSNDDKDRAYEYAVELHRILGQEDAHKLIDVVAKLASYLK